MKPNEIVLIGVKNAVLAFQKTTGEKLWKAGLASGLGDGFVSVIGDDKMVYAHSGGKLYCLDLFSGRELWHDGLSGLGYGIASIALPGAQLSTQQPPYGAKQQADASSSASASSANS